MKNIPTLPSSLFPARKWISITASVVLAIGLVPEVKAQLYAYEPFDYVAGTEINTQVGGIGFTGGWAARDGNPANVPANSFLARASSLTAPVGLPTSGGHAFLTGQFGTTQPIRTLIGTIAGVDGTTTWFSYIGQRQGPAQDPATLPDNPYPRGVNISLFRGSTEAIGLGNSTGAFTNEWSLIPSGSGSLRTNSVPQSGVPFTDMAWVVMRIDHIGDNTVNDNVYLWINPDPLGGEPLLVDANVTMTGVFDYSNIDIIRPFVGNTSSGRPYGEFVIDELRLGGSWAAMTMIPEPGSLSLLAFGALTLLATSRRRS